MNVPSLRLCWLVSLNGTPRYTLDLSGTLWAGPMGVPLGKVLLGFFFGGGVVSFFFGGVGGGASHMLMFADLSF